jgi:hypothetical protein
MLRFRTIITLFEICQASGAFVKNNMRVKVRMEHWLNDTARGMPNYPEKTVNHCHCTQQKPHVDETGTGPEPSR